MIGEATLRGGPGSPRLGLRTQNLVGRESFVEPLYQVNQADAERQAPLPQFDHIEPARAALAFAHVALLHRQLLGQGNLRETRRGPGGTKLLQQKRVLAGVQALEHRDLAVGADTLKSDFE